MPIMDVRLEGERCVLLRFLLDLLFSAVRTFWRSCSSCARISTSLRTFRRKRAKRSKTWPQLPIGPPHNTNG